MKSEEVNWYKIVVLIASILALSVGIMNIVYFNKIRLNPSKCSEVTQTQANTSLWLNIAMVILASITLIWSFIRLVHYEEPEDNIVHEATNTIYHPPEATTVQHGPQYIYRADQN